MRLRHFTTTPLGWGLLAPLADSGKAKGCFAAGGAAPIRPFTERRTETAAQSRDSSCRAPACAWGAMP